MSHPEGIHRVGIVFSGGPAPGANAVISAAASAFLDNGREVLGFFFGFTNLEQWHATERPLVENEHYRVFVEADLRGIRNQAGIVIGTSRTDPGVAVIGPDDLAESERTRPLAAVLDALRHLQVDALVTIGGDGTLRTASLLHRLQAIRHGRPLRIVHLPKTIDNDYYGIDFTFGFFTAVDVMAKEVLSLRADALATSSWFVVETMGRKAGWLAYGVAIAGEADLVLSAEDVGSKVDVDWLANAIVDSMLTRETHGRHAGVVVIAEGVAELLTDLPRPAQDGRPISLARLDLGKLVASRVADRYRARTGRNKKVTGIQLGYESRSAPPHAFDVMLGSQLGIGAYRALVEEGLDACMVSATGQLDLTYVPFDELIDPLTLRAEMRLLERGSDYHRLARFLETRTGRIDRFQPGRRDER